MAEPDDEGAAIGCATMHRGDGGLGRSLPIQDPQRMATARPRRFCPAVSDSLEDEDDDDHSAAAVDREIRGEFSAVTSPGRMGAPLETFSATAYRLRRTRLR